MPSVMSDEVFDRRVKQAINRVHSMDRVDGFKDRELSTILASLLAGIKCTGEPDSCLFDAYVMLGEVCGRV